MHRIDRNVPVANVRSMEAGSRIQSRSGVVMLMVGGFAVLAVVIAVVRIYGVMAYGRPAAGAGRARGDGRHSPTRANRHHRGDADDARRHCDRVNARRRVVPMLVAQLFQIEAIDPLLYATATTLIVGVAGLACSVPVYRAVRINPATVLRGMKPESLKFKV